MCCLGRCCFHHDDTLGCQRTVDAESFWSELVCVFSSVIVLSLTSFAMYLVAGWPYGCIGFAAQSGGYLRRWVSDGFMRMGLFCVGCVVRDWVCICCDVFRFLVNWCCPTFCCLHVRMRDERVWWYVEARVAFVLVVELIARRPLKWTCMSVSIGRFRPWLDVAHTCRLRFGRGILWVELCVDGDDGDLGAPSVA